jgi:epoxyqueuosine reductase QueG
MDVRTRIREALAPVGLDLVGVASVEAWDAAMPEARRAEALLPGARSIVVVANGGGALWEAMVADLRRDPRGLTGEPHPLDAFVKRQLARLEIGAPHRWFRAAADETTHIDFRVLASLAGLGAQSRLGLLMHPVYGPWVGLRAACFVAEDLVADAPGGPDLCAGCDAPCVAACPAGAFPGGRWDVDACGAFHFDSPVCERTCHAREACPVGAEHTYSRDEIAYHYHRASGRRALRALVGVPDGADPFEGDGPHWQDWRKRVDVRGKRA